ILIATGSEVEVAMQAMRILADKGVAARVVSMPCTQVFDAQPIEYREGVLPDWCRKRIAIEAGITDFWRKYVGLDGEVVGLDRFGASAPAEKLYAYFGITAEAVVDRYARLV
ncbi:MAG TPA: transketolase C-terminal domain-containing protein, partial [Dokdonella sp.]|nr:transketolase C-terminal domain-containing protein [Dokdonella sp.]